MRDPTEAIKLGAELRYLLLGLLLGDRRPASVTLVVGPVRDRTDVAAPESRGYQDMSVLRLERGQEHLIDLTNIRDHRGRPTSFDGVPTWESNAPTVVDVRPSADGLRALVGSFEELGAATITITGDGRHGDEVAPKVAVISVLVVEGDVDTFEATAEGDAVDRTTRTSPDDTGTASEAPAPAAEESAPAAPAEQPADAGDVNTPPADDTNTANV